MEEFKKRKTTDIRSSRIEKVASEHQEEKPAEEEKQDAVAKEEVVSLRIR